MAHHYLIKCMIRRYRIYIEQRQHGQAGLLRIQIIEAYHARNH